MAEPQKFSFDTVFDAVGGVAYAAPRPKRMFAADEVEQIRKDAYAEGERAALASIAAQQQAALAGVAAACHHALPTLAAVHRYSALVLVAAAVAHAGTVLWPNPAAREVRV